MNLSIFFIQPLKVRFVDELSTMEVDNSLINYVIISNYGPHYLSSIEIFKNNKIFGTGIKTFRKACNDISIIPPNIIMMIIDLKLAAALILTKHILKYCLI
jgi:hypothetical protein